MDTITHWALVVFLGWVFVSLIVCALWHAAHEYNRKRRRYLRRVK